MAMADPEVQVSGAQELARDLVVIPDRRLPLVPNIGVIGGTHSVLVVDTGLGVENAGRVLDFATEFARGRRLFLTTTHFHPEHAFGAQVFAGAATYLINQAQADDLSAKGLGYLEMFKGLDEVVARRLEGIRPVAPDLVYDERYDLDLGGRVVQLRATGRAHSRGDQVITAEGVMFTGDLVEAAQFAIFPWFPPHDTDVSGTRWLAVMERLVAEAPRIVVPGHGDVGGPDLLSGVRDYLRLLRDETWVRRDAGEAEEAIAADVRAVLLAKYPQWGGEEWIEKGVRCLCTEHDHSLEERS
jgi:glyoxylase-like metal-dependent hydrolase (beta-lactamase superfamily II)